MLLAHSLLVTAEEKLMEVLAAHSKLVAFSLLDTVCEELSVEAPELKSWELECIHEQARFMLAILKNTAMTR